MEEDQNETLKLPLLPLITTTMPDHDNNCPSNQTLASVPFKWEQQPGIPRPCTDIIPLVVPPKSLLLPPCRTKSTPSPTTVLDGPYNVARPKFSSLRFFRDSFDSVSPENAAVVGKKSGGLFGNFKGRKKKGVAGDGGSLVFSSSSSSSIASCDSDEKVISVVEGRMRRNGSLSVAKSTYVWVSMYEGLKQVIPWKSTRKSKIEVQA